MKPRNYPAPRPAPRNRITVAQFRAILEALRELPPDDWRDEVPNYPELITMPLIPADPNHIPF